MEAIVDKVAALADAMVIVHDNQIDQNRSLAGLRQELRDMREELDAVRKELARYGKADKPSRDPTQRC
ncbi:g875 [Coccomyxa elongata]